MCASFGLDQGIFPFLYQIGIDSNVIIRPPPDMGSGRPTDKMMVVLRNPKTLRVEVRYPRWGLVPHWPKDRWTAASLY